MSFASGPFLVFLFFVISVYFGCAKLDRMKVAQVWLLLASLGFCAWSGPAAAALLLASLTFNYQVACRLTEVGRRSRGSGRTALLFGLAVNLAFLGYFKYGNFLIVNLATITGNSVELGPASLPLGISFYTITQIMFLVDSYQGVIGPQRWLDYALYVSFFPQLSAGPISRFRDTFSALSDDQARRLNWDNVAKGVSLFALGLFQKAVVADILALVVKAGFESEQPLTFLEAWLCSISFTLQLFFDFSGYCDMASGIGLILNIQIPWNFDAPFRSRSIIEFWTRWHITLSSFIFTYVYYPMVRSRGRASHAHAMIMMMLAMLLAGLWHGAAWTYVWFGLLHGLALVTNHTFKKKKRHLPKGLSQALTLLFVNWAFVFFRAGSVTQALNISTSLLGFAGLGGRQHLLSIDALDQALAFGCLILGGLYILLGPSTKSLMDNFQTSRNWVLATLGSLYLALIFVNSNLAQGFLYVDF